MNSKAFAPALIAAALLSASSAFALDIYGPDDPIPFAPRSSEVATRVQTDFSPGDRTLHHRTVVDADGAVIGHVRGFAQEGDGGKMRIYVQRANAGPGERDSFSFVTSQGTGHRGPLVYRGGL